MNSLEFVLLGISQLIIFLISLKTIKNDKYAVFLLLIITIPLVISLEKATQFLTIDEICIIEETMDLKSSEMRQWNQNALRTTDVVIGTVFSLIPDKAKELFGHERMKMIAKAFHWMLGFIIIVSIFILLLKYYILPLLPEKDRHKYLFWYFIIYFYSILLIPVNILALKVFNYDLISMLLGIVAGLLILIAIKNNDYKFGVYSIIIGMLAAQEKLIASPVLLISFVVFVTLKMRCNDKIKELHLHIVLKDILFYSIQAISIAFMTGFISFSLVGIIAREGNFPLASIRTISAPIVLYLVPLINEGNYDQLTFDNPSITLLLITIAVIWFVSIITSRIFQKSFNSKNLLFLRIKKNLGVFSYLLFILLFVVGVIATYNLNMYWTPAYPISSGNYLSKCLMNGVIFHFNAPTFFLHTVSFIAFSYASFMNCIPSIYIIFIAWLIIDMLLKKLKKESFSKTGLRIEFQIILIIILFVPLLYGVINIPTDVRYFNMFVFMFIIIMGLKLFKILLILKPIKSFVLISFFCTSLILEVIMFRPVIGAFMPVWNNPPSEYSNEPLVGEVRAGAWTGWGGGIMLAGDKIKQIAKKDGQNLKNIRIYWSYPGEWLDSSSNIKVFQMGKDNRYTKDDYYIFTRAAIIQEWVLFPEKLKPLFTINYRQHIQTWVFRGDQLKSFNIKPASNPF